MQNPDSPGAGAIRPKFARLPIFCAIYGESRSSAYRLLATGRLRAVKSGRSLLIDCEHAEQHHFATLPEAKIRVKVAA